MKIDKNTLYRLIILSIFVFAIFLRGFTVDLHRQIADGDEKTYEYAAKNLVKYRMFTADRDGSIYNGERKAEPASTIQIGYPIVITIIYAIFGEGKSFFVFGFQLALSIINMLLAFGIMKRCKCNKIAILIVLILYAVYPGFIYNINKMLTEPLFTTLLLLFSYFFILAINSDKIICAFFSAIVLGMATFVRGLAFPYFFMCLYIFYFYVYNNKRKKILIFSSTYIFTQMWWWIRNYIAFHKIILLTESGEGPKIWGAMPYYIDMNSSNGKSLTWLLSQDKNINIWVYLRWRIFGFFNYMWNDIWDEKLVHSTFRCLLWIQLLIIVVVVIVFPIMIKKLDRNILFLSSFPIAFTIMNMPYHGLPRYLYPSVPFIFIILGFFISNKKVNNIDEKIGCLCWIRKLGEKIYLIVSIIFSITLCYSIFIFGTQIRTEMSEWRLNKYAKTSIREVNKKEILTKHVLEEESIIPSSSYKVNGKYINDGSATSIINGNCNDLLDDNVVSKIELNIKGGYVYDYSVIYWKTDNMEEMDENHMFKFPINCFEKKKTIFVDGNVNNIMVVPVCFSKGKFSIDSIVITKYKND